MKRLFSGTLARWLAEIIGVATLATGAWMIYAPAGVIVAGIYCVVIANSGGDGNASTRTGS